MKLASRAGGGRPKPATPNLRGRIDEPAQARCGLVPYGRIGGIALTQLGGRASGAGAAIVTITVMPTISRTVPPEMRIACAPLPRRGRRGHGTCPHTVWESVSP